MKIKWIAGMWLLFCFVGRAHGAEVTGEFRYRIENFRNYNLYEKQRKTEPSDTTIHFTRLDIKMQRPIVEGAEFTVQARASMAEGDDNADAVFKPGDSLRFHQAHIDFSGTGLGKNAAVRVGRQEMNYGGGLLIGADDWDNTGNSFDAVKFTLDGNTTDYDVFAAHVSNPHTSFRDGYFGGVNIKRTDAFRDTAEFSAIYRSMPYLGPGMKANLRFLNLGCRVERKIGPRIQYGAMGDWQTGSVLGYNLATAPAGRQKHRAYNYVLNLDYFAGKKTFRNFGAEYSLSTGDKSPTDSRHQTYFSMFPSDHSRFGAMDWFGNMNSEIFTAYAFYDVTPKVAGLVEFHRFSLNSGNSAWYLGDGKAAWVGPANFFPRSATAPKNAGSEIDLLWKIQTAPRTTAHLGYSIFTPGDLFKDGRWWNKNNKVRWGYFQFVVKI